MLILIGDVLLDLKKLILKIIHNVLLFMYLLPDFNFNMEMFFQLDLKLIQVMGYALERGCITEITPDLIRFKVMYFTLEFSDDICIFTNMI